jgi:hypothetical protein
LFFISQIIIDGRDKTVVDIDGGRLPTLVYMAREKRPQWPHHFKAGAENALVYIYIYKLSASLHGFLISLQCKIRNGVVPFEHIYIHIFS